MLGNIRSHHVAPPLISPCKLNMAPHGFSDEDKGFSLGITWRTTFIAFLTLGFALFISAIMKTSVAGLVPLASILFSLTETTHGLDVDGWRGQSIYQVLTDRFAHDDGGTGYACNDLRAYCGGTYQGIIKKLDYIQGMGFTAVWISPVVKQIDGYTPYGDAFHGYWAQDIWSLNPHFGSEADLLALSTALHSRGMYLMVDVVTNHMGYNGCRSCVNYSSYSPEFQDQSLFHTPCTINYSSDESVRICWQGDDEVSLPDLRTEDSRVRDVWNKWIKELVPKYGIDGLRVDSTKHVEKGFFSGFGQSAGVFQLGEVFDGDPNVIAGWMGSIDGVMNYASFYWIQRAFQFSTATMNELITGLNTLRTLNADISKMGSFLENHDQPRFPSLTSDTGRIKTAIAFTMLSDGIPIIYQGQEQAFKGGNDPANREALWAGSSGVGGGYNTQSEMYGLIADLNQIRNQAVYVDSTGYLGYRATPIKINDYALALRKGNVGAQIVGVFSNMGTSGNAYSVTLRGQDTGFRGGEKVTEVLGCSAMVADGNGDLSVMVTAGPRVLYPSARLVGSGICGM